MITITIRPARPDEAGLDWNESALSIYRSIGAAPLSDWTVQRLDEQALKQFAES